MGISDTGSGRDRIVGIPSKDFDGLVDHLRGLIHPLPEVIPVPVVGADSRVLVLLRVDPDEYLHPVMVSGRVVYRVPGATVPADRQRVLDLARRSDRSTTSRFPDPHAVPIDAAQMPLWESNEPAYDSEVRIFGGLVLPPRAGDRPWLSSSARDAVVETLRASRLPGGLWPVPGAGPSPQLGWRVRDRRSTWLSLDSLGDRSATDDGVELEGGVHLSLVGRHLTCVAGVRLRSTMGAIVPMGVADLYTLILAELCAARDVCDRAAEAVDAAEPSTPAPWQGWVRAANNHRIPAVLNLGEFTRDGALYPTDAVLPRVTAPDRRAGSLDQVTRDWLTIMLLDLGVRDFEPWLASLPRPAWIANS